MRQLALALLQAGVWAGPPPSTSSTSDADAERGWMVVIESRFRSRSVHYGTRAQCEGIAERGGQHWRVVDGPRERERK